MPGKNRQSSHSQKRKTAKSKAVHNAMYAKQEWKPGNMVYPVPAVMVTVADGNGGDNIITGGYGELPEAGRETEYYNRGMDWHNLHKSPYGLHFCPPRKALLPDDKKDGGICNQSDNPGTCVCHRLLWGEIWTGGR